MTVLRHAVALCLAAYALSSLVPVASMHAFGSIPPLFDLSPERAAAIAAMEVQALGIWLAAVAGYLLAALNIAQCHTRAVWLHAVAIGCDLYGWQVIHTGQAYNPAFAVSPLIGVYILAANFIGLALVMMMARGWGESARQARLL